MSSTSASQSSIKQQLSWATKTLYSMSSTAALDSEVLLAFCLQKNRAYLLTWPEKELTPEQQTCFQQLIQKRLQPQPVAYLTGNREFYSLELITTPDTLVPRPETEMLVDSVLEIVTDLTTPRILELGTGTGAISLAIKKHTHGCDITATDISLPAIQIAQSNALQHHLQVTFIESDWYQSLKPEKFDVIVSNPPYIAASDPYLNEGDLPAEPLQALSSGVTGLEALATIIQGADAYLSDAGWLVLEHGYDQQQAVTDMFTECGFSNISTLQDFNNLARVTLARKA